MAIEKWVKDKKLPERILLSFRPWATYGGNSHLLTYLLTYDSFNKHPFNLDRKASGDR
jgi:hypothetical protein